MVRTTASVREFEDRDVSDADLYELLELARFAPSGGNRQGWKVLVIKDRQLRESIRDLYVEGWAEYQAHQRVGKVPFAPIENRKWTKPAVDLSIAFETRTPFYFSDNLDKVPVLLAVFVDMGALAVLDNGLDRQSIVGGASVYPFAYNILLAANAKGIGGVLTTTLCRREDQVARLVNMPVSYGLAALIALGYPKKKLTSLKRAPVEEFTFVDRFDGDPFI